MLSAGICWARQSVTALRSRGFELMSPPPMRAAVTTSRISLVQARPRAASVAPFLRLIVAHLEWPLMSEGDSLALDLERGKARGWKPCALPVVGGLWSGRR